MSSNISEKGFKIYTSHPWRLIKTCFLILTWITLGTHLEIIGPTLKILGDQTGVTYNRISTILITRNAGYMVPNIVGAIIQNIVKRYPEGLLSIAFLIAAISVIATPFIHNLYILATIFFFQGISQGITDLGGTNLMLTMWGDNAAAPLNLVHLGYGFGAVFANLFVQPFLIEENKINNSSNNSTNLIDDEKSNILVPYSITSFICLLITVGHFIFAIRESKIRHKLVQDRQINYEPVSTSLNDQEKQVKNKDVSEYSPKSCGNGSLSYGLLMSICFVFYMFFLSGNDQTFGKFFFSYLESSQFSISKKSATWGMIIYWLSYSIGRLICAIITIFVPVHLSLVGLWIFGLILAITWFINIWIFTVTPTILFILGAFTGLVFSPTFPLSFGFINQRLNVNPLLLGCLLCGSAIGAMFFQKIAGYLMDTNVKRFPILLIICVILSATLFTIALVVSSIHKRKLKSTNNSTKDKKDQSNINEEEQQMETYLKNNEQ